MTHNPDVHRQFAAYFENPSLSPFLYLLSKRFSEGHICLDLEDIDIEELKEAGFGKVELQVLSGNSVVGGEKDFQPFILWKNKLYMQRYFFYESVVYEQVISLINSEKEERATREKELLDLKDTITHLFPADNLGKPDWQMVAAISAVLNRFNIITGGPGTGKTTTVAKILALLLRLDPDTKIALAAPTGKAAARMAESLKATAQKPELNLDAATKEVFSKLEPSTLHRLLGAKPNKIYFKHDNANTLPHDLIIVDESSMIDVALFAKLLDAIKPTASVIFLGDKDQLASVEAGSLFGDLCTAQNELNLFNHNRAKFINDLMPLGKTPLSEENIQANNHPLFQHIIELQHSYRFAAGGNIGIFSRAIIDNDVATIKSFFDNHAPDIALDSEYKANTLTTFAKAYRDYILEPDIKTALQKLNNLRVLCATREGEQGVYKTNQHIERYLQSKDLISVSATFYEHRPVMVTGNNYELGLFNGDIGIVRKDETGKLRVYFEDADGNLRGIQPAFVTASETVFAMTIHKSQGSEFDNVLVRLPDYGENAILARELLYTAVTRAKKKVIVQASEEVILETCGRRVKRGSGIAQRFEA